MADARETSYAGSCPSGKEMESKKSNFGGGWCEIPDSNSNRNLTGGDNYDGYGSISRRSESSLNTINNESSEGMKKEQTRLIPERSFLPFSDRNNDGLFSTTFRFFDQRADCDGARCSRRNNESLVNLRQCTPKIAWMTLLSISALYLASFGIASFYNGGGKMSIAGFFLFDKSIKKLNSLRPPLSISRSILLVLHAESAPVNPIVKDLDRKLTANGMRDAQGLGIYLKQHNIPIPEWIFVSPSERTAYTTELIRQNWASDVDVAFEDYLYTLGFNDYFTFVAGLNDHIRRVMIVGHNPAILNTAKMLMRTHGIEEFPDCGLLEIVWDDLKEWNNVQPHSGSSTLAIDPNHKFFFSSPEEHVWGG